MKSGDKRINFKKHVDRMKKGPHDIHDIIGESIAPASSSPFLETLRTKGLKVISMVAPVEEYRVLQITECDGRGRKLTKKEGLDIEDEDENHNWKT